MIEKNTLIISLVNMKYLRKFGLAFLIGFIASCKPSSSVDEGKILQFKNYASDFAALEQLMESHKNDLTFRIEQNSSGELYLTDRKTGQYSAFDSPQKNEFIRVMKNLKIWSITTHSGFYTVISVGQEEKKKIEKIDYSVYISNYFGIAPSRLCSPQIFEASIGACDSKIEGNWYLSYSWIPKK